MTDKIQKFHFEEFVFILHILSSELNNYDEENLVLFGESIEGRIEVLFEKDFLILLSQNFNIPLKISPYVERIKHIIIKMYSPRWSRKLAQNSAEMAEIKAAAITVLDILGMSKEDPIEFSIKYLNYDL